jgi:translocation and assembly module TamB
MKGLGWLTLSLLTLLVLTILLIRIPYIQNRIVQKAVVFLENKIGTTVRLKGIYIGFPKKIILEGLYLEDQQSDTLLFVSKLSIDTDLWGLLQHRIQLNKVELNNCVVGIRRSESDKDYNFGYIITAFASDSTTASTPWVFAISDVQLSQSSITFHDRYSGNILDINMGDFYLKMDRFDPSESDLKVLSVELSDAQGSLTQSKGAVIDSSFQLTSDSVSSPLDLDVDKIRLKNVALNYLHTTERKSIKALLGDFMIESNKIDLRHHSIDLNRIQLSESVITYQQGEVLKDSILLKPDTNRQVFNIDLGWTIKLKELSFENNSIQYEYFNAAARKEGLAFNHLQLFALTISIENIEIGADGVRATINNLSGREKGGFSIESLTAHAALTDTALEVRDFRLVSGNSKLFVNATAIFPSCSATLVNHENVKVEIDVRDSFVALKDILFFAPSLTDSLPVILPESTMLYLSTQVHGTVNDLTIDHMRLQTLDSTTLMLTGNVKSLPDWERLFMQLTINRFYTTRSDMVAILPDSILPAAIQLPAWMELQGNLRGTIETPEIEATVVSSIGRLEVVGKFDLRAMETYDAVIKSKQFDIGKLINQEDIGTLDMQVTVKGSGLTMENLDAVVDATVFEFQYKQYDYKDLKVEGYFKNYVFSGTAILTDKNLEFVLKGDLEYHHDISHYKLGLNLKNVDLKELNLSERLLKASATVEVDLATNDFKAMNGTVAIRKFAIYHDDDLYMVDSLLFASFDQEDESIISIRSDIVTGDFTGSINLFSLPATVKQHVNQYFSLQDTTLTPFTEPQNFKFLLVLKNTELLTEIIFPDLEPFVPGKIQGEFNSMLGVLNIDVELTKLKYARAAVDSFSVHVNSDESALNYKMRLKNVRIDTLSIDVLEVAGKLANDSLHTALLVLDSLAEEKYVLGGTLNSLNNGFRFHFNPDQVILNYQEWGVPPDNYFQLGNNVWRANNLVLSNGVEKMSVTSSADSSILFQFQHFQLSTFTNLVTGIVPASGELNGALKFATLTRSDFNSTLQINQLAILEKVWGDVGISVGHDRGTYTIDLGVNGDSVNVQVAGSYNTKSLIPEFNIRVTLSPVNLALLEPLSFGWLKDIKGVADGMLHITGNADRPSIRGSLQFNNTRFLLSYLNNSFSLQNETISFEETGIVLKDFKIRDSRMNEAIVRGTIRTQAYKEFDLNLMVNARNFQLLNTREGDNELYYGLVRVNAEATITGNMNEPKADMTLRLLDGSELTYVIPQAERNVLEQRGIVQFVNKHEVDDPFLSGLHLQDTTQTAFTGLNLTAKIELTDEAILNLVIDPLTGDMLSVSGHSSLLFEMDATGSMNLFGRYEITSGSYNFTFYKIMKREFDIVKGSSIVWSGDLLNATLDIRANYQVMASPLDLVYAQISSASQSEINSFNQRLPFLIHLYLKGKLLLPEISFILDMPENKRNEFGGAIYAKLQDINTRESDLSKQVFALLILRRFIADNPFETQAISSVGNTARVSVSRILSEQLNRLSENIEGVQLSFDLRSYETYSGDEIEGQTKVQLGLTKNLFNDRLVVKLSGNVNIEGDTENKGEATDYIGDLALEYKLTSDGRLRVTGFRLSNYDMIDGEVTETGAGLIYIKDYNTLRELFRANAKQK